MSDGPYSRVYHSVMDDPCFDGIREDMRLFGSWSMMLIVADQAYPAPAFVPPTVSRASLKRLVAAELVELLPGHRYRLRGQEKERAKRSESGRNAAAVRWQSGRNARRDETRKDETSSPRAGALRGAPRNGPMTHVGDAIETLVAVGEARIP